MKLLENLLVDANNFETSSWDITNIAAESYTAPAPDGSLTAYNAVEVSSNRGKLLRDFTYDDITGTDKDIIFGVILKKTGVGSLTALSLDVRSANLFNYVTLAYSGTHCEVYSDIGGSLNQLTEIFSGWYYVELSIPNSSYSSTVRIHLSPAGVTSADIGATAYWMPYLAIEDKIVRLDAEYDLKETGQKFESQHRTRAGNRYVYKWGQYDEVSFGSKYLTQVEKIIVNSWWSGNDELLLLDEYGTKVMSCQVLNKKTPFGKRIKPYNRQFQGTIQLGTY